MSYKDKYLKNHLNCNKSVESLFREVDLEITQHLDVNKRLLADTQIFLDKIDSLEFQLEEVQKLLKDSMVQMTIGVKTMNKATAALIEKDKIIAALTKKSNQLTGRNNEIH